MAVNEDFLTLYMDPGEDFGWCVGHGLKLVAAGTHKMWLFADIVWEKLDAPGGLDLVFDDGTGQPEPNPLSSDTHIREGVDPEVMKRPIGRFVCEDWRLYPWALSDLKFDQCRTARVIGAMTFMARVHNLPMTLQGANIKSAAQAAGAEELYYKPQRENRHQNDAIQHFVFFTNTELLGLPLPIPDSVTQEAFE